MTDEQVWEDLSRFALAMKRGATVVFNSGETRPSKDSDIDFTCANAIRGMRGIREIIKPPAKKIRPLNAEEWKAVAGCVLINGTLLDGKWLVPTKYHKDAAVGFAASEWTCHPPGFPSDVRKLYVAEVV